MMFFTRSRLGEAPGVGRDGPSSDAPARAMLHLLMLLRQLVLLLFLSLTLTAAVWADKVHLTNGGTLEGEVTTTDDKVVITNKFGSVTLRADEVRSVEHVATPAEEYKERAKALAPDDAQGHYQLALCCLERGLKEQADAEARATLAADPGQEGAHRLLGHVFFRGRWVTEAEQQAELAQAALPKLEAVLRACREALADSGSPALARRVAEVDALSAQLNPALAANLGAVSEGLPARPFSANEADQLLTMLHDVFTVGQRVSLAGLKDPGHVSQARQFVVDYFRAAPGEASAEVLARLRALEDVSPAMVAALAQAGPFYEAEPAGEEVRRAATGFSQVEYVLVTPPGHDPRRSYPLLVACQGEGGDGRQASERWRQPCQAHGYLLACPTLPYGEAGYGATAAERAAVLATVEDVARTYHVDPDRVFLTGVSAGGNAVWDVGLHHADRFAGLIPESGTPLHEGTAFTQYLYLRNAEGGLAVYALVGETDAGVRDICAEATKRLQALGVDAQSVVVPQRGHGAFPTEDDSIFAWMDAHRRNPTPRSVSAQLHRLSQGRVYWVEVTALAQPEWDSTQSVRLRLTAPAGTIGEEEALELARAKVAQDLPSVRASVGKDNTVAVSAIGVGELVVWLSPQLVDFSRPVTIVVNGVTVWSRPVTAEPAVLLREMKRSWDLGRVFFAAVECDLVAKTARVREGK